MKKTIWIVVLIVVILLVIFVGNGDKNEVSGETIKIGYSGIQSGPLAWFGELYNEGLAIAEKEINENGGINGSPIEIIYEDNAYTGRGGVDSFHALVSKGSEMIISMGSVPTVSLSPLSKEAGVPILATAVLPDIPSENEYATRMTVLPEDDAEATVMDMVNNGVGSVSVMYINNDLGLASLNAFREIAANNNISIVNEESFVADATEFNTYVLKALEKESDAIFVIDVRYVPILTELKRQIESSDRDTGIYINYIAYAGNTVLRNPDLFEGVHLTAPIIAISDSEEREEFMSKFNMEGKIDSLVYQALAYDNLYAIAAALEIDSDVENFPKSFESIGKFEGVNGEFNIESRNVGWPVFPAVFSDGKLSIVE